MYQNYLKTSQSKIGRGTFTTVKIPANVPVCEITGTLYDDKSVPDHPAIVQVGQKKFLGPSGGVDDYINHSCDPNCALHIVGNRAILYSLYVIQPNNEITFDYSTSSTDTMEEWKMDCLCGSYKCRKIISGIQYLTKDLIEEYHKKKMIPLFLKHNMFI